MALSAPQANFMKSHWMISICVSCSHVRSRSETWWNEREVFSLQLGNSLHSLWEFGVSCRFRLLTVLGYSNTPTDWKLHREHVRAFHPADITCFNRTDWKRQQRDGFIDANRVFSVRPSGERSCLCLRCSTAHISYDRKCSCRTEIFSVYWGPEGTVPCTGALWQVFMIKKRKKSTCFCSSLPTVLLSSLSVGSLWFLTMFLASCQITHQPSSPKFNSLELELSPQWDQWNASVDEALNVYWPESSRYEMSSRLALSWWKQVWRLPAPPSAIRHGLTRRFYVHLSGTTTKLIYRYSRKILKKCVVPQCIFYLNTVRKLLDYGLKL